MDAPYQQRPALPQQHPILERDIRNRSPLADLASVDHLRVRGWDVVPNSLPNSGWFRGLYDSYDALSDALKAKETLRDEWDICFKLWKTLSDNDAFYCNVPLVFRDRAGRGDKDDKEYLQYCLAFATSPVFRASALAKHPAIKEVFLKLEELHYLCVGVFSPVLNGIAERYPGAADRLTYNTQLSPVILKLLRYNPTSGQFATLPHLDKSALSILLHSDDDVVNYRLGRARHSGLRYTDLSSPIEYPAAEHLPNHAVMIAGMHLSMIGVSDIPGTPHAVWRVADAEPRHSIVAFYLAPYVLAEGTATEVPFENDVTLSAG